MCLIVIDARELRTSSGRYVERLLHYLQSIDHENNYSVLLKPEDVEGWQPANTNFKAVACPHKEFTFGEQLGLLSQINSLKPDLVHFTFPQQPILRRGLKVTTFHDLTTLRFDNPSKNPLVFKVRQKIYGRVIKLAARKSAAVITPSEFVKNDLAKYASTSPDKITVTYEAADFLGSKSVPLDYLEGKQFIMYLGRPTPHKNLPRLIEAYKILKAGRPDLKLVLAGKKDANYTRIENDVKAQNLEGVIFTDYISDDQLRWLYENCQAYVFPSLSEGFGLPALEAMLHGAPVASSNATCLPEVYGDAAEYFDPLDVKDMAAAIGRVLDDDSLRQKLVEAGKAQAGKYSWLEMAKQTLEVYKQALNQNS